MQKGRNFLVMATLWVLFLNILLSKITVNCKCEVYFNVIKAPELSTWYNKTNGSKLVLISTINYSYKTQELYNRPPISFAFDWLYAIKPKNPV